jgi:DNA-binding transcriptional ArsR family regulator
VPIADPKTIRALAHPLRLDLLDLLAAAGPATAAHCGRVLGVSQASCSFHLRQLAKYEYVEEAGPGPDRRERQWRLREPRRTIRAAGADAAVQRQLERIVVGRDTQAILDAVDRGNTWGTVSAIATVSREEAADLKQQWLALLRPYVNRTQRPGHRHIRYFMAATPLPEYEPEDT